MIFENDICEEEIRVKFDDLKKAHEVKKIRLQAKAHVLSQLLSKLQDWFDEPFNLREAEYSENQSSDELVNQ